MEFVKAVLTGGLQYVFMLAVAFGAVMLGISVRKKKDRKAENQ